MLNGRSWPCWRQRSKLATLLWHGHLNRLALSFLAQAERPARNRMRLRQSDGRSAGRSPMLHLPRPVTRVCAENLRQLGSRARIRVQVLEQSVTCRAWLLARILVKRLESKSSRLLPAQSLAEEAIFRAHAHLPSHDRLTNTHAGLKPRPLERGA